MMKHSSSLLISVFVTLTLLAQDSNGFSSSSSRNNYSLRAASRLDMAATASSGERFFDDFNPQRRDGGGEDSSSNNNNNNRVRSSSSSTGSTSSKFVSGDDLHRLRHQVLALRLELQEARRNDDARRVQDLERAIMKTQQVDAEFVYTVSLERQELAEQDGNVLDAQRFHEKAMEARNALPQFQLEGLWVGKYGDQGYEMINVTYHGDTLMAHKVTSGTNYVPRGAETFRVDLSPQLALTKEYITNNDDDNNNNNHNRHSSSGSPGQYQQQQQQRGEVLSPIELGDSAAQQWGCKYLQRFAGQGQVASEGFEDSQFMEGQLILVNEYFSFAWLPIGHQVFFGRPTPELILKLMKDETKKETGGANNSPARSFLEKCWEETEHIEDDMEVDRQHQQQQEGSWSSSSPSNYYYEEGCFE